MKRFRPKRLDDQVVLITGASSGIGLVTARRASRRGARVALVARNRPVLEDLRRELEDAGGRAVVHAVDVGEEGALAQVASDVVAELGGIDTWVNNAAVSIYGNLWRIRDDEHRRLFDTNYFGAVHGSLAALDVMRERGGVLINVGSVLADRAIPQQGPYCASKHALKGFTDALRMEIDEENLPIAVCLIKPSAIDTPYKDHAKNYLEKAPKNPPPVYAPETVAHAILSCAESPRRDVIVGGGGKAVSLLGKVAPRATDRIMESTMSRLQLTDEPAGDRDHHGLFHPIDGGRERGHYPHPVFEHSLYTRARLHPVATSLVAAGVGLAVAGLIRRRRTRSNSRGHARRASAASALA